MHRDPDWFDGHRDARDTRRRRWNGRWIPQTPFWQRFTNYLPATLLVTIAVPSFTGDPALTTAVALALVAASWRLNLVISMTIGIATVAALRVLIWAQVARMWRACECVRPDH